MRNILLSLLLVFGLGSVARADIFNPITKDNQKLSASIPTVFDTGTILTDAAAIINYLGVKEGEAYNFNRHKWVTTTGATVISFPHWGLSLGISMLNADGVTGNIEWNVGKYLPTQSVPVMKYTQYLYLMGGAGIENDSNSNAKFASIAGAEFKFTF